MKKRKNYIYKINSTPVYIRTYDYMYVDHSFFYFRKNKMKMRLYQHRQIKKVIKVFLKLEKVMKMKVI